MVKFTGLILVSRYENQVNKGRGICPVELVFDILKDKKESNKY
jgi:hypothetical protein